MAANDVYLITFTGGNPTAVTQNTFTYQASAGSSLSTALEMATVFRATMVTPIRNILSINWLCLKMVTQNLFDNSDFEQHIFPAATAGARTGDTMPAFVTLNFASAKPSLAQDPARKLMGWLSETDCAGQNIINTGTMGTALGNFAAALGQTLVGGSGSSFAPVIVKRVPYTTPKGNKAYRLPKNAGESVTLAATGWGYDNLLDHRTTRKLGRGI